MRATLAKCLLAMSLAGSAIAPTPAPAAGLAPWEQQLLAAARDEPPLTVYTSHYNTEQASRLCAAFEARYRGLQCNFVRDTAQVLYQRLLQGIQAHAPVASVFSSTDLGHFPALRRQGLLLRYQPHNAARMVDSLKRYNDRDGHYWVTAAALILVTYNSAEVAPADAPHNWTDLLDPRWKGKVAIAHPAYSGYAGTWVVLMRKLYGWDYLDKLAKNQPRISRSMTDTATLLARGERLVAAGPAATTLLRRDKGHPLAVAYPSDGALLMVSPSAVVASAPSPNAGKLYLEFLLSPEAGALQVRSHAMAVMKGVPPAPGSKPLEDIKVVRPSQAEISQGIPEVMEKFRATFGP